MVLILTAFAVIIVSIIIHAVGTSLWLHFLVSRYTNAQGDFIAARRLPILVVTALVLIFLHFAEILLWAFTYLALTGDELPSLEAAIYFSAVTFTSLGYGDITLSSTWRLLSGFEAIDGILLIGWTTAFLFSVLQRTWGGSARKPSREENQP